LKSNMRIHQQTNSEKRYSFDFFGRISFRCRFGDPTASASLQRERERERQREREREREREKERKKERERGREREAPPHKEA